MRAIVCLLLAASAGAAAGGFPEAAISNGILDAKLYLPDPERGYYRATRFDWSGVIHSLRYSGHEYFGVWFKRYDPKIHDAITGPVEEFRTGDSALGYAEAPAGGTFIRIGAGVVRKPNEAGYQMFQTYDIVDPGKWTVNKGPDWIEFTHNLASSTGYAYLYRKTVRLIKGKPGMRIEHALRNTGKKVIETSQYNHNFFVIDKQPTGPDFTVGFPFNAKAKRDLRGLAEVRAGQLVYLRELEDRESTFTELEGFGSTAQDYDFRIENRKVGAGVQITGDKPLSRLVFWSIRTTLCPEPYIQMRIEPGAEEKWNYDYRFYTLPSGMK